MDKRPSSPDELDRDTFYAADDDNVDTGVASDAAVDDDDDDDDEYDEYELEPIDPEVLDTHRRLADEEVARAGTSLEIDEIEAAAAEAPGLDDYVQDLSFRFQTKHLLMATAALAVFLSMGKLMGSSIAAFVVVVLVAVTAAHAYLAWQERIRQAKLRERRQRLVEMARSGADAADGSEGDTIYDVDLDDPDDSPPPRPLKFAFSMREMLIAMGVSALILGLLALVGPKVLAGVLGFVALAGLAAFAIGVELPAALVLGWWVILLLYIGISLFAGAFTGDPPTP